MQVLRSVVAVLGGFMFMTMVASVGARVVGAFMAGALGASILVSAVAAIMGGWIAARIGSNAPFQHAVALAVLIAFMTVLVWASASGGPQPWWYFPVIGLIGVGGVLAGGRLRASASAAGRA